MTLVRLLPVVLATWLLGAHFFRGGSVVLAACCAARARAAPRQAALGGMGHPGSSGDGGAGVVSNDGVAGERAVALGSSGHASLAHSRQRRPSDDGVRARLPRNGPPEALFVELREGAAASDRRAATSSAATLAFAFGVPGPRRSSGAHGGSHGSERRERISASRRRRLSRTRSMRSFWMRALFEERSRSRYRGGVAQTARGALPSSGPVQDPGEQRRPGYREELRVEEPGLRPEPGLGTQLGRKNVSRPSSSCSRKRRRTRCRA